MCFGVWGSKWLKKRPVGLIETFARFQAGFLSSEDVHRIFQIFMDFELLGLLGLLVLLGGLVSWLCWKEAWFNVAPTRSTLGEAGRFL